MTAERRGIDLDGGDFIATASVLVSLFALWYARRAAEANEGTVDEAKEANRLHAQEIALIRQHRQVAQDQEAAAASAAQDDLVRVLRRARPSTVSLRQPDQALAIMRV